MICVIAMAVSCDVHEFPAVPSLPSEPTPPAPERVFRLTLHHDQGLPLLGEFDYNSGNPVTSRSMLGPDEAFKPHCIRYTINTYSEIRGILSREPDTTYVFTRDEGTGLDAMFEIDIPKGDYNIVVWTDYVDAGSTADKYYDTSDFSEIILSRRGEHYGSCSWRDGFYGLVSTTVSRKDEHGGIETVDLGEATIEMKRPMARYTFISTDLRRFIENESKMRMQGAPSKAPGLDDYRVRFIYTRYMPCSFNLFTGKPADSWTGVEYESRIEPINDDEARVGFDYVFVNGDRTAATVGLEVLDKEGNLLARIPAFDVPLERSRHTIVKGEFLTTKSGGAMGINPDFDGSFNIEIK